MLRCVSLGYEEMATVLADDESVVNSRPLTYISEHEIVKPFTLKGSQS